MSFDAGQLVLDVKLLSASLSAQNAPSDILDSQYPAAAAMRLYHVLFDDLGACLGGAHHLVYFPPGDVAAIPPAALLSAEPPKSGNGYDLGKAHWLILDYAVSTVTSIRDFLSSRSLSLALSRRPGGSLAFAGIGDPRLRGPAAAALKDLPELPETRDEVNAIAKLFKVRTDLKLGDAATEENFRSLPLDQYQILHFATHGLMRDDIDGLSEAALVFTPGDAKNKFDDGLLTAADVANLNLAARLVVLSACNTANFDPTIFTSPLQGLASAFASAGAPTTVASLWSVNNQTGMRLMTRFYQKLLSDGCARCRGGLAAGDDRYPARGAVHGLCQSPLLGALHRDGRWRRSDGRADIRARTRQPGASLSRRRRDHGDGANPGRPDQFADRSHPERARQFPGPQAGERCRRLDGGRQGYRRRRVGPGKG